MENSKSNEICKKIAASLPNMVQIIFHGFCICCFFTLQLAHRMYFNIELTGATNKIIRTKTSTGDLIVSHNNGIRNLRLLSTRRINFKLQKTK